MSRYDRYDEKARSALVAAQKLALAARRTSVSLDQIVEGMILRARDAIDEFMSRYDMELDARKIPAIESRIERRIRRHAVKLALEPEVRALFDLTESVYPDGVITASNLACQLLITHTDLFKNFTRITKQAPPSDAVRETVDTSIIDEEKESEMEDILDMFSDSIPHTGEVEKDPAFFAALGIVNLASRDSPEAVGRQREIDALLSVLIRFFKPNAMLVGEPGVGKTALVEGLGRLIATDSVPERLRGFRILSVNIGNLIAGTEYYGSLEKKVRELISWLDSHPKDILFLDEVHQISDRANRQSMIEMFKPALSRGKFRCIAATTPADYHRNLDMQEAFTRRFQTIRVDEPDRAATLAILDSVMAPLCGHYGLEAGYRVTGDSASERVSERAYDLALEYLPGRRFPDKAIDILDRSFAIACLGGKKSVDEVSFMKAVGDVAGLPVRGDAFAGMAERIGKRIIGQEAAIDASLQVISMCKRKIDLHPERPDGVLLFAGPSGVGKTGLASVLASELSGSATALSRVDMSEYSQQESVSRLLGTPQGYVGYDDEPLLTRIAQRNPRGVLLLDEFEKAHPSVVRLFLQIFDEGKATDHHGVVLEFSRMTIIATTNAGAERRIPIGFTTVKSDSDGTPAPPTSQPRALAPRSAPARRSLPNLLPELMKTFPIELLNRFDEIVEFTPLTRGHCERIIREILVPEAVSHLGAAVKSLAISPEALAAILDAGHSAEFGARELSRAFRNLVLRPISDSYPLDTGDYLVELSAGQVVIRRLAETETKEATSAAWPGLC